MKTLENLPALAPSVIQRQLALNASMITWYHDEIHKEQNMLKAYRESNVPRDDTEVQMSVSALRFYRTLIRKYVSQQVAFKREIKARKKPKTVPVNDIVQLH